MLLYSAFIYLLSAASAVFADPASKQGRPETIKSGVAGATLTASSSVSTVITRFRVPKITENLHTTSSAVLGVTIDGVHGCPGVFAGVQIIVNKGQVYYYAVSRETSSVNYETYQGADVNAGDEVTFYVNTYDHGKAIQAYFSNSPAPFQKTYNLDAKACSSYASWVLEGIPNLPLPKFGTVDLEVLASNGHHFLDTHGAETFSHDGVTASLSGSGRTKSVSIAVK